MDLIRRNFDLKLAAVVIAVVLWFTFNYLTSSQAYSKTLEIPLALHNVAAGLVAQSGIEGVTVELTGPRSALERLVPGDFAAFIDCAGKSTGTLMLPVSVIGPESDKVRSVTPSAAIVVLDQFGYRRVPVVSSEGDQGSIATDIQPRSVTVAGGQTALSRVFAARVSIEDANATKLVTVTLKPMPVDAHLTPVGGLTVTPSTVRVAIEPRKEHG
jgi:YbbR domain-containing protein